MFLLSGNYYLRCVLVVRAFLQHKLIVLDGAAPEHDSRLVEEFRDYLKANKLVEQRAHSSQVHQEAHEVPQDWERSVDASSPSGTGDCTMTTGESCTIAAAQVVANPEQ
jgi:hypothetical protein